MSFPSSELGPPPLPLLQASVQPYPLKRRGGTHSTTCEGRGSPNSDDWRKSPALCLLCAPTLVHSYVIYIHTPHQKEYHIPLWVKKALLLEEGFSNYSIWLWICNMDHLELEGGGRCWDGSVTVFVSQWSRFTLCTRQFLSVSYLNQPPCGIYSGWDLAEWIERLAVNDKSRNSPGFDLSILRHSGIWGPTDEAVLNNVQKKLKNPSWHIKTSLFYCQKAIQNTSNSY